MIIYKRIYKDCVEQIAPNQFRYFNAVGSRETLFSVQVLFQRCKDVNCNVFVYPKAFDRVRHDIMIRILKKIEIGEKYLSILTNLYWR